MLLYASARGRVTDIAKIRRRRLDGMSRATLIRIYGADLVNYVWASEPRRKKIITP